LPIVDLSLSPHRGFAAILAARLRLSDSALKDLAALPPEAEPQEKLNPLTESQRLSERTAAKPQQADGVWLRLAAL